MSLGIQVALNTSSESKDLEVVCWREMMGLMDDEKDRKFCFKCS